MNDDQRTLMAASMARQLADGHALAGLKAATSGGAPGAFEDAARLMVDMITEYVALSSGTAADVVVCAEEAVTLAFGKKQEVQCQ